MEKQLEDKLNIILRKPGVVGCVVTDKRGLCLSAKGIANPDVCGMLSSVADQAKKIDAAAIIRLESDKGYVLIQKKSGFTLAIFKKFPNGSSNNIS